MFPYQEPLLLARSGHWSSLDKDFTEDIDMALSVINNSTAIGAQSSVNNASNSLAKTIKALSTGLRINSAADDASGLAVSEKLRAQISGLNKAATNAQDAISMLQTAEGAMGSMTSMVQRIRELAVQAGDPAYTASDRAMLQLEVDQLKEEINRVSNSTEFNTKKLLNGDAAGVWSASTDDIEAIIKGAPVEGNYKISYTLDPGTNSVYKSNIMRLGEGQMSYDFVENGTAITKFDNIQGMLKTGYDGALNIATTASGGVTAGNRTSLSTFIGTGNFGGFTALTTTFLTASAATTGGNSYSVEIEALTDRTISGYATIRFRVRNQETGDLSDWKEAQVNSSGRILGATSVSTGLVGLSGAALQSSNTVTFSSNLTWSKGDKMLINVVGTGVAGMGDNGGAIVIQGAGSISLNTGFYSTAGETVHTVYTSQMDESGNVYYGQMDVTIRAGNVPNTSLTAQTGAINLLGTGDVASEYTKLSQIEEFTNSDGRMLLANTQEINIYGGNGNIATVTLEGSDTIEDLQSKLQAAIVEQLGMGATGANAADVNSELIAYVSGVSSGATAGTGDRSVAGTFVVQGAILGDDSNLTFVGDEAILNALGFTQIREASDSSLDVVVSDAHTGAVIGEDTISDGRLRNVIQGVDVIINPESAANITFNTTNNRLEFTGSNTPTEAYLHIKDNATKAAIGANEGQVLDISIGRLDTVSMGIDDITVATFDESQKAITKLDMALEQISKARATAGAQMNRLEYTVTNLNTTRENMVAAESRIRDLDIAQASSDLTAQQVLLQSATAMLAQANQIPSYAMQLIG